MGTITIKGAFRNIAIFTALAVLLTSGTKTFAIEGLKIAVKSGTNVVLCWPSTDSETYLIQYRPSLDPSTPWQTLADYYYAASGTNVTSFVHTDIVRYPSIGSGTNIGNISPMSMSRMSGGSSTDSSSLTSMALSADGNSVPLALYPPGFDLSGLTITDPATGESVSGEGYSVSQPLNSSSQMSRFQPMGADESIADTNQYTGFYQVARDGAHMFGVTNGAVWSGKVTVPLEVANPSGPYGTVMSVMIEAIDPDTGSAAPIGNSQQTDPFNAPLAATIDTTTMSNGTYNLQAYAHWEDGSGSGEWEAVSPPVSITTSNEITFENFMPQFGNDLDDFGATNYGLVFNATSAHTNVNWTVDFYDSSSNYVGSVSGNSPDGNISFTWDLTDIHGVAHTNDAFFNSYISTDYIDPPAPTFWKNSDTWYGPGQWAIAAQHVFEIPWYNILQTESDDIYNEMDEFVSRAGGNGGLNVNTPANPSDGSAYAINGGSVGGAANWTAFRAALYGPYTRNLVYFGHGGPTGLGWTSNSTSVFIPVTEIASRLGNNMNGTNGHAFRFAFIDACDTANGNLCSALGIMTKPNVSILTYGAARIRPGTYCGWPSAKWIAEVLGGSANQDHINYMKHLQHIWYFYPQTIKVASVQAWGFNDAYGMQNNDLVINGYWDLKPTAYNH